MQNNQEYYKSIISEHPLFCLLDNKDFYQLVEYLIPVSIDANQVIVTEGEIIDCLYVIATGTAKVTRKLSTLEHQQTLQTAEIAKGTIIGLSLDGFASRTGIRMATVTSLSPMLLLKLSLTDFLKFLRQPQIKYPDLKKQSEEFLLLQSLHSLEVFDHLTQEEMLLVIKTAKNRIIPKGTILYKAGEPAHACYYILTGILVSTADNQIETVFNEYQIFGETEFIHNTARAGTAWAQSDNELLVLEHELIKKFVPYESTSLFKRMANKFFGKKHG
jgi:CRP-like cAMP-binding protein